MCSHHPRAKSSRKDVDRSKACEREIKSSHRQADKHGAKTVVGSLRQYQQDQLRPCTGSSPVPKLQGCLRPSQTRHLPGRDFQSPAQMVLAGPPGTPLQLQSSCACLYRNSGPILHHLCSRKGMRVAITKQLLLHRARAHYKTTPSPSTWSHDNVPLPKEDSQTVPVLSPVDKEMPVQATRVLSFVIVPRPGGKRRFKRSGSSPHRLSCFSTTNDSTSYRSLFDVCCCAPRASVFQQMSTGARTEQETCSRRCAGCCLKLPCKGTPREGGKVSKYVP